MDFLELLRLIAEDKNRSTSESNRQAIENLTETIHTWVLHHTWIEIGKTIAVLTLLVILAIMCISDHKKIKKLEKNLDKK